VINHYWRDTKRTYKITRWTTSLSMHILSTKLFPFGVFLEAKLYP